MSRERTDCDIEVEVETLFFSKDKFISLMIFVEENNAQFIKAHVGEGGSEAANSNPLFSYSVVQKQLKNWLCLVLSAYGHRQNLKIEISSLSYVKGSSAYVCVWILGPV